MTTAPAAGRFVGQSVARREDPRLLTGRGRYVDDNRLPGMLHIAFLRSDVARGTVTSIDVTAARQLPGVRAVFTAADLNPGAGPLWTSSAGPGADGPADRPLAAEAVKFVGDPIAVVVADSRAIAEDGVELIDCIVESAPAILGPQAATSRDLVHAERSSNVASSIPALPDAELDAVIDGAAHVVTRTFRLARATNVPMEPRGLIASWSPAEDSLTIIPSSQNPHEVKAFASRMTGVPAHRVHVRMADVGGGFGQKMYMTRDEAVVLLVARRCGRPVSWIEDRRENLIAANQARADTETITMAFDADGTILAVKVHLDEDVGAYPLGGIGGTSMLVGLAAGGPYRVPKFACTATTYYTNTCPKAPYRGPWAVETIAREQLLDHAAREIGLDPLELRRRNVLRVEDQPYALPSGLSITAVTPAETLELTVEALGWEQLRAEQRAARANGRLVGVGLSVCVEPSAVAFGASSTDEAVVRLDPSGKVQVLMGTGSHGHSLETTIAQIVADELGCDIVDVQFVQGDTDATPWGPGTGGSRSAVIAGGAAHVAGARMGEQLRRLAAHLLEASVDDIELAAGTASVRGTPARALTFAELATAAYVPDRLPPDIEPGLEARARYQPGAPFTWSNSCHACVCEIDPETGVVELQRYIVAEDCGVMINPMVVEGQIAGGVVQGIGGVLFEEMAYDGDGNPLATTFLDYLLPTASEIPTIEYVHLETPSTTVGGHKGMGEGGAIAAPAAVANAIADALAPLGVIVTDFPLGPSQIRDLIRSGSSTRTVPEEGT